MSESKLRPQLYDTREFQGHLRRLLGRGPEAKAAHERAVHAMGRWASGEPDTLARLPGKDERVPNAVRYAIDAKHVLVSYEHAEQRIPLMVGTREESERWLNEHRGRDFTVNTASGIVRFTPAAADAATTDATTSSVHVAADARGAVLDRLPATLLARLALPDELVRQINELVTFEAIGLSKRDVWERLSRLAFSSSEHRHVVMQVLALLANGQDDEAVERVNVYSGRSTPASREPVGFAKAAAGPQNSDYLVNLTGLEPDEILRFVGGNRMTDWMLFLHPEQRRLVEREYNSGPARLIGVSGSGKTAVLVHRANSLARRYDDERVLVLTLNPALVQLLGHLLDTLCSTRVRERITVETVYDFCYRTVKTLDRSRLIEKRDDRSGETLESCWRDFQAKPHAIETIGPVMTALELREGNVNASDYILDELIWIRSGFGRENRQVYLACERPGRGIQLPRWQPGVSPHAKVNGFPADTRQRILKLLGDYEEYMRDGGLMDHDGVSLEAYSLRHRIRGHADLRYRCVLVDEMQDCSTVELAVIAAVPSHVPNGLFLAGDPVQKVYAKQHDLRRAGIEVQGRSSLLKTNYRNTRQILEAAFTILQKFQGLSPVPAADILEPDYAFRDGARPKLFECDDRQEQRDLLRWSLASIPVEERDGVCVCSPLPDTLDDVERDCEARGIATYRVKGEASANAAMKPGVKLVLMQDVKGYEFARVFLLDLMDGVLPPKGMPWEERWRPAFQIYVAMTRARDELVMSFVFNRSILLAPLQDTVEDLLASDVLPPTGSSSLAG